MSESTPSPEPSLLPGSDRATAGEAHTARSALVHHYGRWVVVGLAVVVLAGGAFAWYSMPKPASAPIAIKKASPSPTPAPTPAMKASPLTGMAVSLDTSNKPVFGVMIENHPDARPQSGLADAGVVYEANAEGGITRFLAIYLETVPAIIGPVRSLRTYFLDWGLEYGGPVAHAGGNADALDLVTPLGMKDLNALDKAAPGFYRTKDRVAPHNLYSSDKLLTQLLTTYKFNQPATFTQYPRKADTPNTNAVHPNIHIDYSYGGYEVDYKYSPISNDYGRSVGGVPHTDRNTGAQIRVKNIVVEYMPTDYGVTRIGEQTVLMGQVGSGKAIIFRDGDAIVGTWKKTTHNAHTSLIDSAGVDIPLDAGNTWFSIVPVGKVVGY